MKSQSRTRMRVVFSARPEYGHVYPMMPLLMAMLDAGNDVVVATGGAFVDRLRALGIATYQVGTSIVEAMTELVTSDPTFGPMNGTGRPDWNVGARLFLEGVAPHTVAELPRVLDDVYPDLVIYEQADVGAAVAAAKAGIPAMCHAIAAPPNAEMRAAFSGELAARLWRDNGIEEPPVDLLVGDAYLDIYPSSLQKAFAPDDPRRVAMRPVAWSEPGYHVPAWVTAQRKRRLVYLTLGTIRHDSVPVLRAAIEGLATLDVDVLVALGPYEREALGDVPPTVHIEQFVNQAAVLPLVDLAVHHGGTGTMLGALAEGIPQLLLPQGADQFVNADAVGGAGLGVALEGAAKTADNIATAAGELLEGLAFLVAAHEVRREIVAMPHPAELVPGLIRFAAAA